MCRACLPSQSMPIKPHVRSRERITGRYAPIRASTYERTLSSSQPVNEWIRRVCPFSASCCYADRSSNVRAGVVRRPLIRTFRPTATRHTLGAEHQPTSRSATPSARRTLVVDGSSVWMLKYRLTRSTIPSSAT